jgi:hypothetical protein
METITVSEDELEEKSGNVSNNLHSVMAEQTGSALRFRRCGVKIGAMQRAEIVQFGGSPAGAT